MCAKVLVVDDDPAALRLVEVILQRAGFEVITALDGPTALEVAEAEHPDVVVLDVMMPGMDGEEVVRELRQRPSIAHIPVLMLSARAQVESKVSALRAGADDYLTKPADPEELIARIEALLARASRTLMQRPSEPGRILFFVGAKGGMGTTVTAVNVAVSLALRGLETCLIDLHWHHASAAQLLGCFPRSTLGDLLKRRPEEINHRLLQRMLVHHHSGVNLLAGVSGLEAELRPTDTHLRTIVEEMAQATKFIVIDAPNDPLCLETVAPLADFVALALTTEPEAVTAAAATVRFLRKIGVVVQSIGMVLVYRWPQPTDTPLDKISQRVGCDFVGAVQPGPDVCREAARLGIPLVLRNQTELVASSLIRLATRLSQEHIATSSYAPLEPGARADVEELRRSLVHAQA